MPEPSSGGVTGDDARPAPPDSSALAPPGTTGPPDQHGAERDSTPSRGPASPPAAIEAIGTWLRSVGARLRAPSASRTRSRDRAGREGIHRLTAAPIDDGPVAERAQTAIHRILRGDQGALDVVAVGLADGDLVGAAPWRERLEQLVAAVREQALEAGYLDPPRGDPFWSGFEVEQGRDVMKALASLGFRVDGRGGWLDERVPTRRELSIAIGYAGVDPVRLRTWPAPEELAALASAVVIAGGDFLDVVAPGLSQAEVAAIVEGTAGAERLDELWRDWDRARPLLLSES
jgi:hypothetical protein